MVLHQVYWIQSNEFEPVSSAYRNMAHHAVSSMKMPSRSSCMKSSPPAQVNTHNYLGVMQGVQLLQRLCFLALTAQVLQDKIQLPSCLEGIDEIHYEGVLHLLQDVPLCLGVGSVLGITNNHSLAPKTSTVTSVKGRYRQK